MASVNLQGVECHTNGNPPSVGDIAPAFTLTNAKLNDQTLASYKAEYKFLYVVPSLDTMLCAQTSSELNERAKEFENTQFIVVSADLPFAQQRFCKQNKLKRIKTLSLMRSKKFAEDYGVLIQDGTFSGLTARAIFILDKKQKVLYSELVPEIAEAPDFDAALHVLESND